LKKNSKPLKRFIPLYIMALPGLLYLLINNYIPMAGIVIAFKNINFQKGILKSDWVGFENFKYLFATKDAFIITRNTILYNITFIVLGMLVSISLAIFLSELKGKRVSKLYQTVILLPHLVSMIIVSYMAYAFLSEQTGFLNKTLFPILGLEENKWYGEPTYWPFILVFINIWKNSGYSCIVYLAAILGIDNSYYEAASLDGASIWQKVKYITIPMITPTILMLLILSIGRIFYSDFGLFYQVPMNSGALYNATNVIDTYVYRALLQLGDIGMSSAACVYQSIVGCVMVISANMIVRKLNEDSALF